VVDRDAGRVKTSHDARRCDVRQRPRSTALALSVVVLLPGMVVNGGAPSDTFAPTQVLKITVLPTHGWILDLYPDGRVHAQWGSLSGDGASVPKGTVRFDALLASVRRLRVDTKVDGGTQIAIVEAQESSATAFYVSDDTLFRYLVSSVSDKWMQDAGGVRFHELLKMHPIYPGDEGS
jgi:hypothetical protein